MKMKSLKAQFIGAIAMVLVAAIAMGSSTYAWFAMNNQVTATGMQVEVKSNSTFLLIKNTDNVTGADEAARAANVQAYDKITEPLTVADADADLYPAMPWASSGMDAYSAVTTATAVTTYSTAAAYGNWITANSLKAGYSTYDGSASTITGAKALTTFTDYVIKKSVTMTLSVGSENAHNLQVTGNIVPQNAAEVTAADAKAEAGKTYYTVTNGKYVKQSVTAGTTVVTGMYESSVDITAVKVLVVTDNNNLQILDYTMNGTAQSLAGSGKDANFTPETTVVADIYIYYDGSADAVYSNNKANLGSANIDLMFEVAVGDGDTGIN